MKSDFEKIADKYMQVLIKENKDMENWANAGSERAAGNPPDVSADPYSGDLAASAAEFAEEIHTHIQQSHSRTPINPIYKEILELKRDFIDQLDELSPEEEEAINGPLWDAKEALENYPDEHGGEQLRKTIELLDKVWNAVDSKPRPGAFGYMA